MTLSESHTPVLILRCPLYKIIIIIIIFVDAGLDPAGPLFNTNDTTVRLDKTDTLFMDNMHTNAKVCTSLTQWDPYKNSM